MRDIANASQTRIVLRQGNRLVTGGIAAICLTTWAIAGVEFLQQVRASKTYDTYIVTGLFALLWILAAAFFVFALLWIAFGFQLISVHDGYLTVENKIGSVTLGKKRHFSSPRLITSGLSSAYTEQEATSGLNMLLHSIITARRMS